MNRIIVLAMVALLAGCTTPVETQSSEDEPLMIAPVAEAENSTKPAVFIQSNATGAAYVKVPVEPRINETYDMEIGANSKATFSIYTPDWNISVTIDEPSVITVPPHQESGQHIVSYMVEGDGWFSAGNFTLIVWGDPMTFPAEPNGHTLRPGIQSQVCTTNYLFQYANARYFIGTAAHCMGGQTSEGACRAPPNCDAAIESLEGGYKVTHAYNSYHAMEEFGGGHGNNDFGLFEISPADFDKMHPKVHGIVGHVKGLKDCRDLPPSPAYGGSDTALEVIGYGRSSLRHGLGVTSAPDRQWDDKVGEFLEADSAGFQCHVYLVTPGIPGDSGGPIATADHYALGAASTVTIAPTPGSNHYTNIQAALDYMEANLGWAPELIASQ